MSGAKQLFSANLAKDAVYLEILEIYSPAVHETVVVGRIPEAAAAAR